MFYNVEKLTDKGNRENKIPCVYIKQLCLFDQKCLVELIVNKCTCRDIVLQLNIEQGIFAAW